MRLIAIALLLAAPLTSDARPRHRKQARPAHVQVRRPQAAPASPVTAAPPRAAMVEQADDDEVPGRRR